MFFFKNCPRVPGGSRQGPRQTPAGSHRGPGRVYCVFFFKNCPRVPGDVGSRQGPRRTPAGQITGLNRGVFPAGARVTFKLVTRRTRGGGGEWTAPGREPSVPCGTAKKRPKTARELPGKAPFVKCDQGIIVTRPYRLYTRERPCSNPADPLPVPAR